MVGLGRALEFAYTGELDAERAYDWGMLNHLVPSAELEKTTRELCERIIALPPLVQWISKRIMRAALDSTLETTMVLTSNAGGILQSSDDAKEARRASSKSANRNSGASFVKCYDYAGSASRLAHIALKAGRPWHAASQAFTFGAASNSSVAT